MKPYVLSLRAHQDIEEIWDYTALHWSVEQAEIYTRQIQSCIEKVASTPRLGRPCNDVRPGYYRYPAGSHILFYRMIDEGVDIVRILHQRMDVDRHL